MKSAVTHYRGESLPEPKLSVNEKALRLVDKLCDEAEEYGVTAKKTELGATVIDAGIKAKGSFQAGKVITEICLGGLGEAKVFSAQYGDLTLLSVFVQTSHPAVATLGSQFAGWQIKVEDYSAIGSGPARALALKPRELYEKIEYKDRANCAVLVLETSKEPPDGVVRHVSRECGVKPNRLSLVLMPTTSLAGSTQISGRIVETGLHRLTKLGLDPKLVTHAWGYAPVAPPHPKFAEAMGRTNDAIMYAGTAYYSVTGFKSDEKLWTLAEKASSSASKSYGRPFLQVFKEAGYDFYKVDPDLFAPAVLIVHNAETGSIFRFGRVNVEVFKRSIGMQT